MVRLWVDWEGTQYGDTILGAYVKPHGMMVKWPPGNVIGKKFSRSKLKESHPGLWFYIERVGENEFGTVIP